MGKARAVDEPLNMDESPARESVGFLLVRAAQRMHLLAEERLRPLGLDSLRHFGILAMIDHFGPVTQQQLGTTICVDRSTMVGLIDALEQGGWVVRHPDESDRRAHRIHITETGKATLGQARSALKQTEDECLGGIDDHQRLELMRILEHIGRVGEREFSGFEPIVTGRRRRG